MKALLQSVSRCEICKPHLSHGIRPVVQASQSSRIVIIGQAPGLKVHQSGIPWDDASGDLLRQWLHVNKTQFYDPEYFALMPMAFCYPGKGSNGDLPPRKECAPQWHDVLLQQMPNVALTLLVGQYAQQHYLKGDKGNLTCRVNHFKNYLPDYFPLPHPSPRNRFWFSKNPWFQQSVLPALTTRIDSILNA